MLNSEQQAKAVELLPYVRTIARSFGRDDEFLSEAQYVLCEALPTYKPECGVPLDKYIGVCVRRRLSGLLRKVKPESLADTEAPPSWPNLHEIVEQLSPRVRECARLRWSEDKFLHEIASELHLKKRVVAARLRDAREEARCLIDDECRTFAV